VFTIELDTVFVDRLFECEVHGLRYRAGLFTVGVGVGNIYIRENAFKDREGDSEGKARPIRAAHQDERRE
jgi:hypothetical protein